MEKRFKHIYFELTGVCNRKCSFCPAPQRQKMFMLKEEAFDFLQQICPFTDAIYWHLLGEPLLHPDFEEITAFAHDLGLTLKLTTNGSFLDNHADYLLNGRFYQINISVQSLNEVNQQEKQRIMNNISKFVLTALEKRPELYINLRYWQNSPPDIAFFAESLNIPLDKWTPAPGRRNARLTGRLYAAYDREFIWPGTDKSLQRNALHGYCHGLIDHCGILCDGRVVPCCLDSSAALLLGDLHTDTFENIINSPRAAAIAENFRHGRRLMDICRNCDFAGRFDAK